MMYLSKASLALDSGMQGRSRLPDLTEYGIHQELWKLFPNTPSGSRPFLFRKEDSPVLPNFLILSSDLPNAKGSSWSIQSKEFNPKLRKGDKLGFALRANPIISRHSKDGKSHRHDVIMHAKLLEQQKGQGNSNPLEMERRSALEWLKTRSIPHGFSFRNSDVNVFGYRRLIVQKPRVRSEIKLSVIEFEGSLEVSEPESFLRSLQSGIGPGKGFGCGLMLVRRLGR